jgi:internalin A
LFLNSNKQIIGLCLHEVNLERIDFLKHLKNIEYLDLSYTELKNFSALQNIIKLTRLNLRGNKINETSFLKYLIYLEELDLSGNFTNDLDNIKELRNLTHLNLSFNQFTNIKCLSGLSKISSLNLSGNQINDISILRELKNLTHLYLSGNKKSDVSILKELKNLKYLDLSANQLKKINGLENLSNLTCLDLSGNKLRILPESLLKLNLPIREWDFNKNAIFLYDNPIEIPTPEVIRQGNESIRTYFEQLRKEGTDAIYEAKLILVGEGGAGKTSLANKIINPDWQLIPEKKLESTKGINILSYQFPYKDKTFRVNILDFGGQEIYHQTHQFFLTKRTLYFLLTDERKEDTDFYHWLNIVYLLSANSPVLIIKNEKSNRSRDIPEQDIKEFNNIKDILVTDLSDNRGLPEIIKALQYYITDLPHIGTKIPKRWTKVRKQLEQDSRYYIDLKEYFAICEDNGIKEEKYKLQLSGEYLHHQVGVCLHFQNHPLLRKTLILKPTWATY